MKVNIILVCSLFFFTPELAAQYLSNPSFEGLPGIGLVPPEWAPFSDFSTPDTEPLECDDFTASDGETYVTLVARGSQSSIPLSSEDCQTMLLQSLEQGVSYSLSMDLASRPDLGYYEFGTGFIRYDAPAILRIYASQFPGEKGDLIYEHSETLTVAWEKDSFTFIPENNYNYLLFEAVLSTSPNSSGNVLIDNLRLEFKEDPDPPLPDDFKIPNVFTPNGDEINDCFEITGLPPYSSLLIFDRSGNELYRSNHYMNDWDGSDITKRPLPSGTYWYVLVTPGLGGTYNGPVYLKRE